MLSDRFRYSAANCSIARTLGVVGEKWTLLVLREAFYGIRRFDDFHAALGCARNLLATRLKTLVAQGLLERVAYRDDAGRSRDEYRLTDKGRDLFPVVVALMQWGDRWTADDSGPAVQLRPPKLWRTGDRRTQLRRGPCRIGCARHHAGARPGSHRRRVTTGLCARTRRRRPAQPPSWWGGE